jgi:hypothetical protein
MSSSFGPQRPPYVEFETRAMEDRAKTHATGSYVAKDVDYAIVRAIGAKDAVEWEIDVWFEKIEKDSDWRREWVKFFRELYSEWKLGNSAEKVNGTHVKSWNGISPAECATLIAAKILTVEDVAGATEEALQRIGMGARTLKQRAQAYVDARGTGKTAEELALLREDNKNLRDENAIQQQQINKLNARIEKIERESGSEDEESSEVAAPVRTKKRA